MRYDELLEVLVDFGRYRHGEDLVVALEATGRRVLVSGDAKRRQLPVRRFVADNEKRRAFARQVVPVFLGQVAVEFEGEAGPEKLCIAIIFVNRRLSGALADQVIARHDGNRTPARHGPSPLLNLAALHDYGYRMSFYEAHRSSIVAQSIAQNGTSRAHGLISTFRQQGVRW